MDTMMNILATSEGSLGLHFTTYNVCYFISDNLDSKLFVKLYGDLKWEVLRFP